MRNENISGNYAPNGLNQYSVIDGRAITYDLNGNLTGDGSLGYSYDTENRLVATSGVLSGLKYVRWGGWWKSRSFRGRRRTSYMKAGCEK